MGSVVWFGFDQEDWQVNQQVGLVLISAPLAELDAAKKSILMEIVMFAGGIVVIGLILFVGVVRKFIVRPVATMANTLNAMSHGDLRACEKIKKQDLGPLSNP